MRKLSLLIVLAGCVDEPELAVETQEIVAAGVIVQRGPECTTDHLSDPNLLRFRNTMRDDLMPRARTVASSPAFQSCVREAITVGKQLPWGFYGPMVSAVNETGQVATSGLPVGRMRALYADRIPLEVTSPQQLLVNCTLLEGFAGWADGPPSDGDLVGHEVIQLHADLMNRDPSRFEGNEPHRAWLAAVIWHEAMHERNYWHAEATYNQHAINIVGACMNEAFRQAEEVCGLEPCAGGFTAAYGFPAEGPASSCGCVRDPGASFIPTLAGSWSWPGLTKFDVDGAGRSYVLAGGVAYRLDWNGWTPLGPALDLVAGGDAVSIKHRSPLIFGAPYWWTIIPFVGQQASTPSVVGEVMTMDSFGRLIRLLNGQVERKQGQQPWVSHGAATSVAAGSDLLYKISNGRASRLDTSSTPAWTDLGPLTGTMTVDGFGTLYNLRMSDQTLWRHRGTYWQHIGGPNDQIDAGASFFTHSPVDGFVYRRAPDNGWYRVAQCDSFAAGGRNVLCRRGATLELYEY